MRKLTDPDGSVNFVTDLGEGQAIEARLVQRQRDEIICYLSSQTACAMGCRMCHLTRTKQTKPQNVDLAEIVDQALTVLHAADLEGVAVVNFNFMARGEPLDNPAVDEELLLALAHQAKGFNLVPRFKISTIMPDHMQWEDLPRRFGVVQPDIYYSFYSTDLEFRRLWFPKALDYTESLLILADWQQFTHKIPIVHFPAIKGVNDDEESLRKICKALDEAELRVDFRVIRYNPFDETSGTEGDYERVVRTLRRWNFDAQLIERIGPEAKASCGMFAEGQG